VNDTNLQRYDVDNGNGRTSEEIRAEIERTRNQMSEKIDSLQERLRPETLKQQAQTVVQDVVRESADELISYMNEHLHQVSQTVIDTVKRHPVPTALVGFGLGWLMISSMSGPKRSESRGQRRSSHQYQPKYQPQYQPQYQPTHWSTEEAMYYTGNYPQYEHPSHSTPLPAEVVYAGDYSRQDLAQMRQQYTEPQSASPGDQPSGRPLQQTINENPLLFGALALAVGAAVGLCLPRTQTERRLIGDARERVFESAQAIAGNVAHQVQQLTQTDNSPQSHSRIFDNRQVDARPEAQRERAWAQATEEVPPPTSRRGIVHAAEKDIQPASRPAV
jgi:gas vesicle protein